MTVFLQRAVPGVTRWGIAQNLRHPDEETGYIILYAFGLVLNILWARRG